MRVRGPRLARRDDELRGRPLGRVARGLHGAREAEWRGGVGRGGGVQVGASAEEGEGAVGGDDGQVVERCGPLACCDQPRH